MAVAINTNYTGEVLEQILAKATLDNELVKAGLIHVEPNIEKKWFIPQIVVGDILQKRKEMPTSEDVKGDFTYSEKVLEPMDFMAYTEFNPRTFEGIWRKWQPSGNLVFRELPADVQSQLLDVLLRKVSEELGNQYINGRYGTGDAKLVNGIIARIFADGSINRVSTTETTMVKKLQAIKKAVPKAIRQKGNLKFIMSIDDADAYDAELKSQSNKNADWTQTQTLAFGGVPVVALANWPVGLIVCTLADDSLNGNFFAAVNLQSDENVIQVDKLVANGEKYFFKMLMKADTNIAWGEYVTVLDERSGAELAPADNVLKPSEYVSVVDYTTTLTSALSLTIDSTNAELGSTIKVINDQKGKFGITVAGKTANAGETISLSYNGAAWV